MERLEYPLVLQYAMQGDVDALCDLTARRLKSLVGFELLTILAPDISGTHLRRIYSTDTAGYPLGLADEIRKSPWFDQLFDNRAPIIAANTDEIAAWLPDFDGFAGIGLGSLVNYPVVVADQTIGLLNLMDRPGSYDNETAHILEAELPLFAVTIADFHRLKSANR
ncbi:GAF domain-containing protein [Hoeflea sp. TYP-13]|uniref:GAF domain-containing protein n=1 Tax=Hoeflea sp. TYP-13 TaxID=3230023 RepID=UPI0034C5BEA9